MLSLKLFIERLLKGLQSLIHDPFLIRPVEKISGLAEADQGADDAALDHPVEVACPGLQNSCYGLRPGLIARGIEQRDQSAQRVVGIRRGRRCRARDRPRFLNCPTSAEREGQENQAEQ